MLQLVGSASSSQTQGRGAGEGGGGREGERAEHQQEWAGRGQGRGAGAGVVEGQWGARGRQGGVKGAEKVQWWTASRTSSLGTASPRRMAFQLEALEAWREQLAWQPVVRTKSLKATQEAREIGEATRRQ
jgi:hypothetical protein